MFEDYSINNEAFGIRIVNVVPVQVEGTAWLCIGFEENDMRREDHLHLALAYREGLAFENDLVKQARGLFAESHSIVARIHSECLLGDALHSTLCDCGEQLGFSLRTIIKAGEGILVYLRQEGRGIGMRAKLACLAVQEGYVRGIKKVARPLSPDGANRFWGFAPDERQYDAAASILRFLGVQCLHLISGNPDKHEALEGVGIVVDQLIDMPRRALDAGSRQSIELKEKMGRNYRYRIDDEGGSMRCVSIVVPCKDDARVVDMAKTVDYPAAEVLVVFNGSTPRFQDETMRQLRLLPLRIRAVSLPHANLAAALELGTREACYDLVLYMDSDCLFAEGTVQRFVKAAEHGEATLGVFKGEVLFDAGPTRMSTTIAKTRAHHTSEKLTAYKPPLLLPKRILEHIGGYAFDERLLWREDSDLDWRIRQAGIAIVAVEGAVILHGPLHLKADLRSAFRYGIGLARARRLHIHLTEVPRSVASTWKSKGLTAALYMLVRNSVYNAGTAYGWLAFRKKGR